MYEYKIKEEEKNRWTYNDCFNPSSNILVNGFVHKNYQINMHSHDFYELNLVMGGKGVHQIGESPFNIESGDLFIIPPGYKHGYYMQENLNVFHLLLHKDFFIKYKNELQMLPGYFILLTVEPFFCNEMSFRYFLKLDAHYIEKLTPYIEEITRLSPISDNETSIMVNSISLYFITYICSLYRQQYSIDSGVENKNPYFLSIVNCIEFIFQKYQEDISTDDLLKISRMSRSMFFNVFQKVTGYSPRDFINNHRVNIAKQLLADGSCTIAEIATDAGFYDSSHFIHVFEKKTGLSPKEYRKVCSAMRTGRTGDGSLSTLSAENT